MVEPAEFFDKIIKPPQTVSLSINGTVVDAEVGETILTVLIREGHRRIRLSKKNREWRGFYCGMGTCFECLVEVDGIPNVRACITPIYAGMQVTLSDQNEN